MLPVNRGRFPLLLALFFCSGACGLTYQVLWLRQLSLVFGVTVYAASTVLAAFMTGLALGSLLAERLLRWIGRPLLAFGAAEILIGASALATPLALELVSGIYVALNHAAPDSLGLLTLARLVGSLAVLLVPTMLMGVTLPLLSASPLVSGALHGSRVGALYAMNTAGAVTGAVVTGFYLIGAIGMQRTFLLAALVNVTVGVLAWMLSRRENEHALAPHKGVPYDPGTIAHDAAPMSSIRATPTVRAVWMIVAVSGFASLALEIVWFRILVQFLAATTYAFTMMLATVLAGIAIGAAMASRLLRRDRDWIATLVYAQVGTGLAAVLSMWFLGWSYQAGWRTSGAIQGSAAAILPAALLMGLSFPIALKIAAAWSDGTGRQASAARSVGRVYALNVIGAIVGALAGGFLILPTLGSRGALLALSALYIASGLMLLWLHPRRWRLVPAVALGLVAFVFVSARVPDPFDAAYARRHGAGTREIWRDDGIQTAVSVHGNQFQRILFLDGLHQANDTFDMVRLHRIIGHLPMVLHPAPADALVVGLGGGATAGAVSQHIGTRVQIVELSDGVRRAARFFSHVNYDVLNQPNVRLRVDDGRNFLLLTDRRFDVVTADIIQPVHAGAGNLYSREYFTLVRHVLREGGLVMQWIGRRPESQYKLIMRTFIDVFPNATLWLDGELMVGSVEPLRLSRASFDAKRTDARTRAALDEVGLDSFDTLRAWFTAGPVEMKRFVGQGLLLTDDRPLIEYHRSLPSDDRPLDISSMKTQ